MITITLNASHSSTLDESSGAVGYFETRFGRNSRSSRGAKIARGTVIILIAKIISIRRHVCTNSGVESRSQFFGIISICRVNDTSIYPLCAIMFGVSEHQIGLSFGEGYAASPLCCGLFAIHSIRRRIGALPPITNVECDDVAFRRVLNLRYRSVKNAGGCFEGFSRIWKGLTGARMDD